MFCFFFVSCGRLNLKLEDQVHFEKSTDITAMAIADLDGNGNPELVVAVMSSQINEFSERVPVSTYIYIFEKKKNKYRYIWKSGPLSYLNTQMDAVGEKINNIVASPNIDDHSVFLVSDKGNYKLEFIDGYYVMNPTEKQVDVGEVDKNMIEYLRAPVDDYSIFTGKNCDFFITGKKRESSYQITFYKIRYAHEIPFSFYARWNTVPLTSFKVIPGIRKNLFLEATTTGIVNIYSMKKI